MSWKTIDKQEEEQQQNKPSQLLRNRVTLTWNANKTITQRKVQINQLAKKKKQLKENSKKMK